MSSSILMFDYTAITGESVPLSAYANKVLLIVNTASECGFTPQFEALETLYQQYKDRGFNIIAFPCDQFGQQEPGSNKDILQFCRTKFNVSFSLSQKIDVNGDNTPPLFDTLKRKAPGVLGSTRIKWNFTKFLINKKGEVVSRYAPATKPENIADDIEAELNKVSM